MNLKSKVKAVLESAPVFEVYFRRLVWSRIHFPEAEMEYLSRLAPHSFDVAVDVGAALGGYAWILNRISNRVIAFEPGEVHADFFQAGLRGTNIELERKAVGSKNGTVSMYTPGDDTNARHSATLSKENPVVQASEAHVNQVPLVSLDAILETKMAATERLDFLKVDVEGYELAVFEGAIGRIAKDFPLVLCEIEARHNLRYKDVFGLLRSLGYQSYILVNGSFTLFENDDISGLQSDIDLAYRLSTDYRPGTSKYINNFIFSHPNSKIRIAP
jgi:FkbM family methyltransferase